MSDPVDPKQERERSKLTTRKVGDVRIGEAAKRSGVSVRMVRHYEQQGYLRRDQRARGQHRNFDDEDVQQLLVLRSLLSAGVPTSTAGRVIGDSATKEELQQADQALARSAERSRAARARLAAGAPQLVPVEHQLSLAFDLFLARTRLESLLSLELRDSGISSGDYALLSLASMERITPTSLARLVGVAPSTLTRRLRALVDRGWLSRSTAPLDNRSWILNLTEEGEERIDAALPHARRLFRRLDQAARDQGLDPRVLRSEVQMYSSVVRSLLPNDRVDLADN